ncbi:hypothetical protein [Xanthomarina sp. GH4-25]|uniref:hypothetical protein n=1 Tax=Xanthomarina sp. GH4-25 TaxID=3349335 RepID=UPI003877C95F
MTKSETKILVGIGVLILLIDIFLLKIWVADIEPNIFMSNGISFPRFKTIGINLLIAIVLYFIKKRYSALFFINAIVCPLLFTFFWNSWIENNPYSTTEYTFKVEDRNFVLSIDKNPDYFGIDEIISESKDSNMTVGMYEKVGDTLKLTSLQETMYLYKNQLIGFSQSPNEIELNKTE